MSRRARKLNTIGTVIDGCIRDLQEHRDLGFPVFARGIGTTAPKGEVKVGEVRFLFPFGFLSRSIQKSQAIFGLGY